MEVSISPRVRDAPSGSLGSGQAGGMGPARRRAGTFQAGAARMKARQGGDERLLPPTSTPHGL